MSDRTHGGLMLCKWYEIDEHEDSVVHNYGKTVEIILFQNIVIL